MENLDADFLVADSLRQSAAVVVALQSDAYLAYACRVKQTDMI